MNANSSWRLLTWGSVRGRFVESDPWVPQCADDARRVSRALGMSGRSRLFVLLLALATLSLLVPCSSAQPQADLPFDVVLALDNSGSMKKNDPEKLMGPAVLSFAARLPQDTRLGIVVFDTASRLALELSPVSEAGFTERTQRALDRVDYRGQWTDIPGAVERSLYELREHGRPAARRVIVLFTDGFVDLGDPARNRSRGDWLRSDLMAEVKRESAMIFGIAFTEGADFELIQSVSQQTGGAHFRILAASEMADVFGRVTDRIRQLRAQPLPPGQSGSAPAQPAPSDRDTGSGSIPVRWLAFGVGALVLALVLRFWWIRSTAPAIPATLQDCSERAKIYSVDKRNFRIGKVRHMRLRRNDLVVPGQHVSRSHAEIRYRQGTFYVRDSSTNGTFLNGVKLKPGQVEPLKDGDLLRFDRHEFLFEAVVESVAGGPSVVTVPVVEPNYQPMPPAPVQQPTPPVSATPKARVVTVPPPAQDAGLSATPPGAAPAAEAREPSSTMEICLGCDKQVASERMTVWRGYRLCGECEATALSLQSGQVDAYVRTLEGKRLRSLQTVEKL